MANPRTTGLNAMDGLLSVKLRRSNLRRCLLILLGTSGALVVAAGTAVATPLDEETCTRLKGEQAQLAKDGAEASMERGPVWAKANLAPDKLKEVERYIELQEQILFRCPQPKPRPEVVEREDQEPVAAAPKAKRPVAKLLPADDGAGVAKPKAKNVAAPTAAGDLAAPAAKKPPAKPKPKSNDAYTHRSSWTADDRRADAVLEAAALRRAEASIVALHVAARHAPIELSAAVGDGDRLRLRWRGGEGVGNEG